MFYHSPILADATVNLFYRNFQAKDRNRYSHQGLGVNGLHTVKVLRKESVHCNVHGIWTYEDIDLYLKDNLCTHCIIEAIWVTANKLEQLLRKYPQVHFVVRNHSQIGFLQVEAGALKIINDYLILQDHEPNFTYSSNSKRYCDYFESVYSAKCIFLPNLYNYKRSTVINTVPNVSKLLRIGCFGATRLLKNHTTAAAAAQLIAQQRGCELEFYISVNREEHGKGVIEAITHMFSKLKYAKLIQNPWESWSDFKKTVAYMDLCLQPSFTETFNIVSADACSEYVPIVGTSAIEWLPSRWQADMDDPNDIAHVGNNLLSNPRAGQEGYIALKNYCDNSIRIWKEYLSSNPTH